MPNAFMLHVNCNMWCTLKVDECEELWLHKCVIGQFFAMQFQHFNC